MSSQVVAEIINRAVHNLGFRQQLSTALPEALSGYELTDQEITNLQNMDKAAFATWADNLEEQEQAEGMALGFVILGGGEPDLFVHLIPRKKDESLSTP
jgi:hypothetical protein